MNESAEQFIGRKNREWTDQRERSIRLRFKDIGRRGWQLWYPEQWTFRVQHNLPEKVLVIERLRRGEFVGERFYSHGAQEGDREYRLGYYIVGAIGRPAGRWRWGQYAQLIPHQDFIQLIADARADGTNPRSGRPPVALISRQ